KWCAHLIKNCLLTMINMSLLFSSSKMDSFFYGIITTRFPSKSERCQMVPISFNGTSSISICSLSSLTHSHIRSIPACIHSGVIPFAPPEISRPDVRSARWKIDFRPCFFSDLDKAYSFFHDTQFFRDNRFQQHFRRAPPHKIQYDINPLLDFFFKRREHFFLRLFKINSSISTQFFYTL